MMQLWTKMRMPLSKSGGDERGATAIEYCLLAGGIALAILVVVFSVGAETNGLFESVESNLDLTERCVEVGSNCNK